MSTARALLACLAISCPAWLSAQSIVQTFNFGPSDFTDSSGSSSFSPTFNATVNQFNPAVGILTSIDVTYSFTFSGSATIGANPGGGGYSVGGSVLWNDDPVDGAGGDSGGGGGGPGSPVSVHVTASHSGTPPGLNFATATGSGTAILGFGASLSMSGFPSGTTYGTFQLDSGTLQLTYGYSAIPEPDTYALFAGLAGLGVASWHRRKRLGAKLRSAI
jgi:hypothetical protein